MAKLQLQNNNINAKELRTQYLMQRKTAMNLENKITCYKTITNMLKIKEVINMWQKIKYITLD